MDAFVSALKVIWDYAKLFLNTGFFIALVGAGAGAFGGALGAQIISDRIRRKADLLEEIRSTNAAIMVAFSIRNSYLALKDQLVQPIKEGFDQQNLRLIEFKESVASSIAEKAIFNLQVDFRTITPLPVRTDILQTLIFEKISLIGRPLSLLDALDNSIHVLNGPIVKRNQLIGIYQEQQDMAAEVLSRLYFGQPDDQGAVDSNYPDSLEAIHSLTDDCVFFSKLLCDDLFEHGEMLTKGFKKTISRKDVPAIGKVNFEETEKSGLMPNSENYEDLTTSFAKQPQIARSGESGKSRVSRPTS